LMPDRFSNGDPANDSIPGMMQGADRSNPDGRHGGDIKGIADHLGYLSGLGITALWINPLLENNNPAYSYHGYAITDFYNIDPRFGTNRDYVELVKKCHDHGIKVIKDMVFNHCSIHHWLIRDMPEGNWINSFDIYTRSNFRGSTLMDPHASEKDRQIFLTGWFDKHMADLNQRNELLSDYLIQNTIWWIEYSGIDGIRVDTQPYSFPEFTSEWSERIFSEYPDFNVVGEAWLQKESFTSAFQKDARFDAIPNPGIPVVTDFPLYFALASAFTENEGWTNGLARLYYVLAQDFLYAKPENKLVFCDNHDLNRYFSSANKNIGDFLLGMTFIMTTRGIPMIYYGTEILMEGYEHDGHGQIRKDFPGGWHNDTVNFFDRNQLDSITGKTRDYLVKLIKWRTKSKTAADGKLIHFIPENGVYVYFRMLEDECVMVAINKDNNSKSLETKRFSECLENYSAGLNVITGEKINDLSVLKLEPESAVVLQLE
ncbi:MAG: cyclomaltodextrinase C-terminal domain-containing protein, partial [Bacteroidales bacterium]|nr:cyclomaltodextrinase C-terminal domain-containing protein [Bacteroidales bacterium]